eukprot:CAMPEP_0115884424 /NCGR_PEP_ID=MMETSP0287-20121206/30112_1 /TAXON_ID=412157 /ORGANISM="Chrysochromulina rotalis, Strain UIO044" /LENGTH=96 /DNA_ID=CAMNT_0003340731 /DNA_START=203 /DNA_END=490 /DNA_ORIENTATION=-
MQAMALTLMKKEWSAWSEQVIIIFAVIFCVDNLRERAQIRPVDHSICAVQPADCSAWAHLCCPVPAHRAQARAEKLQSLSCWRRDADLLDRRPVSL